MSQRSSKVYVPLEQVRYISDQLLEQLENKMQMNFPSKNLEGTDAVLPEDPVRREVSLNIQKYLRSIVDQVAHSLIISNMDTTGRRLGDVIGESQTRYLEPFDLDLNEQVRQTYQEWEECSLQAAKVRQEAPQTMCQMYQSGANDFLEKLDARIDTLEEQNKQENSIQQEEEEYTLPDADKLRESLDESLRDLGASLEQLPQLRADATKLNQLSQHWPRP